MTCDALSGTVVSVHGSLKAEPMIQMSAYSNIICRGGSIKEVQEYLTEWWIQNFAKMVNPQFTVWN
jgi:hypothetical protein